MPVKMTTEAFQQKLTRLNVWKRGGERAPHKPLLLLLAMGWTVRGEARLARFSDIENTLTGLLKHFGPPRQAHHPEPELLVGSRSSASMNAIR